MQHFEGERAPNPDCKIEQSAVAHWHSHEGWCNKQSPYPNARDGFEAGWYCSREPGHAGVHIAIGGRAARRGATILERWDEED